MRKMLSKSQAIGICVATAHLLHSVDSFSVINTSQRLHVTAPKFSNLICKAPQKYPSLVLFESKKKEYVEAEDLPAIQSLFNKYCDKDGLMTKKALAKMPPFEEMLVSIVLNAGVQAWPRKNLIYSSRITPRQCRINISMRPLTHQDFADMTYPNDSNTCFSHP